MEEFFMAMEQLTYLDFAFFAGYLEGDGYLGNQCKAQSIDKDLLEYFHSRFGGTFRTCKMRPDQPNRQQLYELCIGRKQQLSFFYQNLYPFLGIRRQAQIQGYFEHYDEPLVKVKSIITPSVCPKIAEDPVDKKLVLTDEQAHWLAGYFIAEGSIGYYSVSTVSRPYLSFDSVDEDVSAFVAMLTGTPYTLIKRLTGKNKQVFRVRTSSYARLQYLFARVTPIIQVSSRHAQKMHDALEQLKTLENLRLEAQTTSAKHITQYKNLQTLKGDRAVMEATVSQEDAKKLAAILEEQSTFLFLILELKGRWKTPRLRIESADKELVEFVATLFKTKTQFVKTKRRTGQQIYRTQTENRVLVLSLLEAVQPFVHGSTLEQVKKGLEYVTMYKL